MSTEILHHTTGDLNSTDNCIGTAGSYQCTQEVQMLPVAPTLRALSVGEEATFPIEQRTTVLSTILRLKTDYARMGWNATTTTNKQNFTVVVKRIA